MSCTVGLSKSSCLRLRWWLYCCQLNYNESYSLSTKAFIKMNWRVPIRSDRMTIDQLFLDRRLINLGRLEVWFRSSGCESSGRHCADAHCDGQTLGRDWQTWKPVDGGRMLSFHLWSRIVLDSQYAAMAFWPKFINGVLPDLFGWSFKVFRWGTESPDCLFGFKLGHEILSWCFVGKWAETL